MFYWMGMTDANASVHLPDDPADHVAAYLATFTRRSGHLLDHHYEPDAVLVPRPGAPVTGADRIAANAHLLGFGLPMRAQTRRIYTAGDIALLIVDWSVRGDTAHGFPVDLAATATDVLRRGPDGRWRCVIDNPYGVA
jgi:ketosteroid isomerase-like protein